MRKKMAKQVAMLLTPTREECVKACVAEGMPAREGDKLFIHYELTGWTYGRGKAKVPISKLSLVVSGWKLRWEESGCPGAPKNATNGHPAKLSGAQIMVLDGELKRINERMKKLEQSYDSHSEMRPVDREEWKRLRDRRIHIRRELGVTI